MSQQKASLIDAATNCKTIYEFSWNHSVYHFKWEQTELNIELKNLSEGTIWTTDEHNHSTRNCRIMYMYDNTSTGYQNITWLIAKWESSFLTIPVQTHSIGNTGKISVDLVCTDQRSNSCSPEGKAFLADYKEIDLSGLRIFIVSQIQGVDNLNNNIKDFKKELWRKNMKAISVYPSVSIGNPGYAVILYNEKRFNALWPELAFISRKLQLRFSHFNYIVSWAINDENFNEHFWNLNDCTLPDDKGKLACSLDGYYFDNIADNFVFSKRMLMNDTNLETIDFIVDIPRVKP